MEKEKENVTPCKLTPPALVLGHLTNHKLHRQTTPDRIGCAKDIQRTLCTTLPVSRGLPLHHTVCTALTVHRALSLQHTVCTMLAVHRALSLQRTVCTTLAVRHALSLQRTVCTTLAVHRAQPVRPPLASMNLSACHLKGTV
jgi:hypothetical protein